jgi:hypothetical protein
MSAKSQPFRPVQVATIVIGRVDWAILQQHRAAFCAVSGQNAGAVGVHGSQTRANLREADWWKPMNDPLSDQAFEKWYNSKHSTAYFDTAWAGWRECARRARENRWAAFSENELVRLQPDSSNMLNRDLFDEIEAELRRRRFLEKE